MRIQTALGKGTKVSIFLPRCDPLPVDAPDEQQDEAAMGRQETVLLVEDEPDVRAFATTALETVNYRVIPVGDAEAAMTVLTENKEKIDVLFTDIVLPGDMDGWGLAEATRNLCPQLKIILTSGNWELASKAPPQAVSDAAVLQKPYSHQELAQVIQSVIDPGVPKRRSR